MSVHFFQTVLSYIWPVTTYFNTMLANPMQILQNNLSLKLEYLPSMMKTPLNFALMMLFVSYSVMNYAGDFVCNLVGILYPLMYSSLMFNEITADLENSVMMNKYWMLFAGLVMVDTLFGFCLQLVPGYYYLKLSFIYSLVRNDFSLTNTAFTMIQVYYQKFNLGTYLQKVFSKLNLDQGFFNAV